MIALVFISLMMTDLPKATQVSVESNRTMLRNVSFAMTAEIRGRAQAGAGIASRKEKAMVVADSGGSLKAEIESDRANGQILKERFYATNEETTRYLDRTNPKTGKKETICLIDQGRPISLSVDIYQLFYLGRFHPANYTRSFKFVNGWEKCELDGESVERIDWEAEDPEPAVSSRKGSFWFSPSKNYAVLKSVEYRRPKPEVEWKETDQQLSSNFVQSNGFWFPTRAKLITHRYYDNGNYEFGSEVDVILRDVELNKKLPQDFFTPKIPDGTRVFNRKWGVDYIQ